MVFLLHFFTERVNITFSEIQGLTMLLSSQADKLKKLATDLQELGHVRGPITLMTPIISDETCYVKGNYYMKTEDAKSVLRDSDIYVREILQEIEQSDISAYNSILQSVRVIYVDAVAGISNIMVRRDSENRGTMNYPPVLPKQLLSMSKGSFGDLLFEQKPRLSASLSPQELLDLEGEFKKFKEKAMMQDGYREFIQAMEDDISFEHAWSTLQHTYPLLAKFFGGLASVFPGTSTVESDFSIIGVEKSDYRQSLTNFSMEGILQCKQFELLERIAALLEL